MGAWGEHGKMNTYIRASHSWVKLKVNCDYAANGCCSEASISSSQLMNRRLIRLDGI